MLNNQQIEVKFWRRMMIVRLTKLSYFIAAIVVLKSMNERQALNE